MSNIKIQIDDSAFNDVFIPLLGDKSRYLVLKGGGGSGKSEFAAQKIILRTLFEENHRILCVRKVGKTIRNSQFKLLKDQIKRYGLTKIFDVKETEMSIVNRLNKNEIISVGLDDREKIKSLTAPTSIWIEEPTELERLDLTQMDIRLRNNTENYQQIVLTFNPISELHWLKERFFPLEVEQRLERSHYADLKIEIELEDGDKEVIKAKICHSTYKDNNFLPKKNKAQLEALKFEDEQYYNIYALGKWGVIGNLVFPKPFPIIERYPEEFDEVIYGLDFGYHHPAALVKIGIKDSCYYVTEKFCISKMHIAELIERLNEEVEDKNDVIYADAQEPGSIKQIDEAGFNIQPSVKGPNSVKDGIDYMKGCKIYSHPDNVQFHKEQQSYKWKEDKDGRPIEGEVVRRNDDVICAVRYAIYSHSQKEEVHLGFVA